MNKVTVLKFFAETARGYVRKWLGLQSVTAQVSWPWVIRESLTGAWQRNVEIDGNDALLRNSAVYACVTGIASDIAKMRIKLSRIDANGVWREVESNSPFKPVLRKPNHYQTRIKFVEQWIVSKLLHGNAYILKRRDNRGIVDAMYVLDPQRVIPLVTQAGDVYYELKRDTLSKTDGLDTAEKDRIVVPASELIHDMMTSLWHPLIGVSPLYACALSAMLGTRIVDDSTAFFGNRSLPSGILTAPGAISEGTATRLKANFEENYGGTNIGRIAVLGDGLKFDAMRMTAESSQLIEQLGWTSQDVARAFHYPAFKLGGPLPPYAGNSEVLLLTYYTDCLQILIESLELSLDEGLSLPQDMGVELDLDGLLRMDTAALFESNNKAVGGGWMSPDEARYRANLGPVDGGASPYLQQQNYSLAALAKRDAKEDPFSRGNGKPAIEPLPVAEPEPPPEKDIPLSGDDSDSYAAGLALKALESP